ncbi:trehalose synthase complex regulatory subunit TSL1 [Schizosaccharomyces japonicus yFS275]|uniref:Trehalose synthase complex regulatory subunit TSL1 n=1 Tax=Schizosaccharomyces japonicus (strain yFS275 / FY16936) TaxID=402676 RepID=B6JXP1_SCHJY|nr:trehalose synthase complex regulatory subunit TSL1 [Schizosaccharomyces japonicus yFS275]EEB05185.1 trehalose synthase complex regulatory subunit TSL1 [Schizosaccharomyces japonicus yFS275]
MGSRYIVCSIFLPKTVEFHSDDVEFSTSPYCDNSESALEQSLYENPLSNSVPGSPRKNGDISDKEKSLIDSLRDNVPHSTKNISVSALSSSTATLTDHVFDSVGQTSSPPSESSILHCGSRRRTLIQPAFKDPNLPPSSVAEHGGCTKNTNTSSLFPHLTKPSVKSSDNSSHSFKDKLDCARCVVTDCHSSNGGLRNSVKSAQRHGYLSDVLFVGTPGLSTQALSDSTRSKMENLLKNEANCYPVFVDDDVFVGHYNHFCKQILWPCFHQQISCIPNSITYEEHLWKYFCVLNEAFADRIVKLYKKGDIIWINDYHLFILPMLLRKRLPNAKIGFFLHVSFPTSEIFRCLAFRKALLEGILGSNLIGFQTEEYARHFLQSCSRVLYLEVMSNGVLTDDGFVEVKSMPTGIDCEDLLNKLQTDEVSAWINKLSDRFRDKILLVGRDKLDHVKGVRQKLLAFEKFLCMYPAYRKRVVLFQVAQSTNEENATQSSVYDIVSRINSCFSDLTSQHVPVYFLRQDIDFPQYLALLTVADALVVSSLREGMNLTCHEYIVCQRQRKKPLVLSEFAGSASLLGANAFLVNPWHARGMAEAIYKAITLSPDEAAKMHERQYNLVLHNDGARWAKQVCEAITSAWENNMFHQSTRIPLFKGHSFQSIYQSTKRRFFVLDWEGTISSWGVKGEIVSSNMQQAMHLLSSLCEDPVNDVYVASSQSCAEMETLFYLLPNLGLIAENGCYASQSLLNREERKWFDMTAQVDLSWRGSAKNILTRYACLIPNSFIEDKNVTFIFHFESAEDKDAAIRVAKDCCNAFNDDVSGCHAVPLNGAIICEPIGINKAVATNCLYAMKTSEGVKYDMVFAAGNDRTDECLYNWASSLSKTEPDVLVTTVNVGSRNTAASHLSSSIIGFNKSMEVMYRNN